MSEIEILEKKKHFDYQFIKVMDLKMWDQKPAENKDVGLYLQGRDEMNIFKDLQDDDNSDDEIDEQLKSDYNFKSFDTFDKNI